MSPHAAFLRKVLGVVGLASLPLTAAAGSAGISNDAAPLSPSKTWFTPAQPDQADWSKKRITRFALVDYSAMGEPTAIMSIPDLDVSVPVYPDSVPVSLEAGASWVTGTARPGTRGNMAIAGHRDSFFRPLEGIPLGTEIRLSTPNGQQTYTVASVNIVDALDTSPLDPTDVASLTLITCHPFRYQGFAPDRYIIRAVLMNNNSQQGEQAKPTLQSSMATF